MNLLKTKKIHKKRNIMKKNEAKSEKKNVQRKGSIHAFLSIFFFKTYNNSNSSCSSICFVLSLLIVHNTFFFFVRFASLSSLVSEKGKNLGNYYNNTNFLQHIDDITAFYFQSTLFITIFFFSRFNAFFFIAVGYLNL